MAHPQSKRLPLLELLALLSIVGASAHAQEASDWPTYMHDTARSGVAGESLPLPLAAAWVYEAPQAPDPAWALPQDNPVEGIREVPRVRFDDAFHTAVGNGMVYFGSSVENTIYAIDASRGEVAWRFFTGGPVRLAPTLSNGRVYAGSDDGHVYCLDASDGSLVWDFAAAPTPERVLGHGRMISVWPIRTGVLVDDGVAYFAAGIWPGERIYVCALDAENGDVLWCNDTIGDRNAGQDNFSPQGYILASESQLFVPSGRNLPAAFDRATGKLLYQKGYGWRSVGVVGGTYALLADGQLYSGANQLATYDAASGQIGFAWFPGQRLVISDDTAYLLTDLGLQALDRPTYPKLSQERHALTLKRGSLAASTSADVEQQRAELAKQEDALDEQLRACTRWRLERPGLESVIVAGNQVIVGLEGEVAILDAASGDELASAPIDGKALGLAVAEGRLLVSTDTGSVHCFEAGADGEGPAPWGEVWEGEMEADAGWIEVVEPSEADKPAMEWLRDLRDRIGYVLATADGMVPGHMDEFVERFPDSVYAPYAMFYRLQNRAELVYWGSEPDYREVDELRPIDEFLRLYPEFPLNYLLPAERMYAKWHFATYTVGHGRDTDLAVLAPMIEEVRPLARQIRQAAAETGNYEMMSKVEAYIWGCNLQIAKRAVPLKLADVRVPGTPLEEEADGE